jgi:hypothetical protein
VNPHSIAQSEATDNFRGDEDILRRLHKIAFCIPQETETLAGDFDDPVPEFGFTFQLTILGRAAIAEFALGAAWLIVSLSTPLIPFPAFHVGSLCGTKFLDPIRRSVQIAPLALRATVARSIVPARKSSAGPPWSVRGGASFRWSLVVSFFAHKLQELISVSAEVAHYLVNGRFFYTGNRASKSSGISKFE